MPQKIFKTFPKFRIFFLWIFSPKVFQDCFLTYCIKSFPKLRKKFPQISRIYQNFFYQTSKLFRKNTEIPKLFQYDYIRINGNIHPCIYTRDGSSRKLFEPRANRVIDCRVGSSRVILRFELRANRVENRVKIEPR